ncbi:MAG: NAD(P)H-dependent oxidoreductase [Candidatus Nomurabacteria bacterium]|nr:MAG: NAD(P)H-dependent oxidoreductase [Candidatus Nomurabacteria bacterium]
MKITVINGSNREEAQSFRIAEWLQDRLKSSDVEVDFVDLRKVDMTFVPDEYWAGQSDKAKAMADEYAKLSSSDGVVIVTPEWGGAASPVLKHFILMSEKSSFSHKPVLVFGVSATHTGGIRPIEDIKHLFKNARGVFVPEPIVINDVNNFLEGDSRDEKREDYLIKRTDYALKLLVEYSKALKQVRGSGIIDHETYPHGM